MATLAVRLESPPRLLNRTVCSAMRSIRPIPGPPSPGVARRSFVNSALSTLRRPERPTLARNFASSSLQHDVNTGIFCIRAFLGGLTPRRPRISFLSTPSPVSTSEEKKTKRPSISTWNALDKWKRGSYSLKVVLVWEGLHLDSLTIFRIFQTWACPIPSRLGTC